VATATGFVLLCNSVKPQAYDLVIIGCGPAGEKAAAQAAYFGKRVAVIERAPRPGGAAVHTGTLPSKTLRETALYLSGHRTRQLYGVAVQLDTRATLSRLMERKDAIADDETERILANLRKHDVDLIYGNASFADANTVSVVGAGGATRAVTGEFILIATGSVPRQPDDIDFADDRIHDSDEVLQIEELPRSLIILGAGVIGCEYACMFAALGIDVTLVDSRTTLLGFLDDEISERLAVAMKNLGIELIAGQRWGAVQRSGDTVTAELADGRRLEAEQLLFAAGRVGCTDSLNLQAAGLSANVRKNLDVDDEYRTAVPHILAVGDVIGFPALASVSMEQARVAVCCAFGFDYKKTIASLMPYGIYTIPEVSSVGETEQSCAELNIDYVVGRALYKENQRGMITGDHEGITKLIVEVASRRLLGVHVIGERASELVHIGQAAIQLGARVDLFIDMVFNYPTLAESYKYAAYQCLAALAERTGRRS